MQLTHIIYIYIWIHISSPLSLSLSLSLFLCIFRRCSFSPSWVTHTPQITSVATVIKASLCAAFGFSVNQKQRMETERKGRRKIGKSCIYCIHTYTCITYIYIHVRVEQNVHERGFLCRELWLRQTFFSKMAKYFLYRYSFDEILCTHIFCMHIVSSV